MRERKFRGLTVDGDFVYGDLINDIPNSTSYYNKYSQRICWLPENGGQANCPVKNGTVGQYTGLKDKSGAEIYEGDIIKGCFGHIDVIQYSKQDNASSDLMRSLVGESKGWNSTIGNRMDANSCEIIGNIHQNPELLK